MLGYRLVCQPVCAGVQASRRFVARPLKSCLRLCARAPMVGHRRSSGCGARRPASRVLAASDNPDDVIEYTPGLIEELNFEVEALDAALLEFEQRLALSQGQHKEDMELLTQVTEQVRTEQQSWTNEIAEMEELMKHAATVEMSEKEVNEMRERSAVLKRKVQLFQGLVKEREREVGALRTQLEDVQQLGELNRLKKEMGSRAAVTAAAAVVGETTVAPGRGTASWSPSRWGQPPTGQPPVPGSDEGCIMYTRPSKAPKNALQGKSSKRGRMARMEAPGLLLLSAMLMAVRLGGDVWQQLEKLIPKKYHVLARVAGVSVIAILLGSTFSFTF